MQHRLSMGRNEDSFSSLEYSAASPPKSEVVYNTETCPVLTSVHS